MALDLAVQIPTLIGSCLSCAATSLVLVLYIVRWSEWRSFRHNLVLNLTLAEWINSANNSISGIITFVRGSHLVHSPGCTANGFIGQLSVQAADFGILSIALSTAMVVTRTKRVRDYSTLTRFAICGFVWVIPTITAIIALASNSLGPVSGNWCWIQASRTDLRYGLTHGWRFAIIIITLCLYGYVFIMLKKHFDKMSDLMYGKSSTEGGTRKSKSAHTANMATVNEDEIGLTGPEAEGHEMGEIKKQTTVTVSVDEHQPAKVKVIQRGPQGVKGRATGHDVARIMILKAYPLGYIILWIPGIINRLIEASGHSSRVFAIAQASTQYIGFVNSLTYVLQAVITEKLKK
ncbi:G protein-coupled glucose receptor regulating Gpa2-domain-containing protein [Elsinoe ampelina]|uniref:G protein-coupled glucose receptor regulating Gpa2-domain-containing protein n=1 Tax=Elsinoe ampelina TaxID=302913 RepID=A0A6A6GIJ1_9PEZI|nr:G protein-coupled glucose receptor regulating Gpa2-domain-containing protein [Elsinoe ampelina]